MVSASVLVAATTSSISTDSSGGWGSRVSPGPSTSAGIGVAASHCSDMAFKAPQRLFSVFPWEDINPEVEFGAAGRSHEIWVTCPHIPYCVRQGWDGVTGLVREQGHVFELLGPQLLPL